ncbi:MAG TPA: zinc ribbon domain-containing protein [Nitrosarchaeum sp.]
MRNFLIVSVITEQSKVVIKFTGSILDTVNVLLNLQVGDMSRLEHVKRMILEDKPLYSSDQQYVNSLAATYIADYQTDEAQPVLVNCRNCSTSIPKSAQYCTLCGTRQKREYTNYDISKIAKRYNPLQIISRPNSYQTLAIIGGLTAMIPVLFILARMDPLLEAINYETGRDISGLAGIFIFLGIVSSTLSAISIAVTFVVKNPKKAGRILFFTAFGVLATSVLIGVVGFVFILLASNVAYKKRHY